MIGDRSKGEKNEFSSNNYHRLRGPKLAKLLQLGWPHRVIPIAENGPRTKGLDTQNLSFLPVGDLRSLI